MIDPFDADSEPRIVAADESLVVVRKPARMHSSPGLSADSLCEWVFSRFPEIGKAGEAPGRPPAEGGLLHRLDYETSGLVLFARTPEALAFMLGEQAEGRFGKEYILRASPSAAFFPEGSRPLRACPLGLEARAWNEALEAGDSIRVAGLLMARRESPPRVESAFKPYGRGAARVACLGPGEEPRRGAKGKAAARASTYATELLEAEAKGEALDLLASISRGFRHQIRAQLSWIGLPLWGDPLYGGRSAQRLYLHAFRLRFIHPETGRVTAIEG